MGYSFPACVRDQVAPETMADRPCNQDVTWLMEPSSVRKKKNRTTRTLWSQDAAGHGAATTLLCIILYLRQWNQLNLDMHQLKPRAPTLDHPARSQESTVVREMWTSIDLPPGSITSREPTKGTNKSICFGLFFLFISIIVIRTYHKSSFHPNSI
jgi:hypothetical protein